MRSLRSLTLNSSLAIISVLLTGVMIFAVGEAFFRIMIGGLPIDPPSGGFPFHGERGWSLVPGRYSYFHTTAFREDAVELNDLGTRNGPFSMVPEKPRLSVLGDSFTFADALNEDEKFTQVLQELVGEETEIVNISVPGYGTGQQMLLLEELVKQGYHPGETVVLVFFTNDILDNVGLDYGKAEPNPRKPVFYTDTDGALKYRRPEDPGDRSGSHSTKTKLLFLRFLNYRAEILAAENPWLLKVLSYVGYVPTLPRTPASSSSAATSPATAATVAP